MKQTWQELAEELRMEIEQWQNPVFETMMGPLPKSIIDKAQEDDNYEEQLKEAYSNEYLLENPYQIEILEDSNNSNDSNDSNDSNN